MFKSIKSKALLSLSIAFAFATPTQAVNTRLAVLGAGLTSVGTIGTASALANGAEINPMAILATEVLRNDSDDSFIGKLFWGNSDNQRKINRTFVASLVVTAGGLGTLAYGLSK